MHTSRRVSSAALAAAWGRACLIHAPLECDLQWAAHGSTGAGRWLAQPGQNAVETQEVMARHVHDSLLLTRGGTELSQSSCQCQHRAIAETQWYPREEHLARMLSVSASFFPTCELKPQLGETSLGEVDLGIVYHGVRARACLLSLLSKRGL